MSIWRLAKRMGCLVSQVRPAPPVLLVRLGPVAERLEIPVRLARLGLQGRLDLRDQSESDRKATPAHQALAVRLAQLVRHSSEALAAPPARPEVPVHRAPALLGLQVLLAHPE